MKSEDMILNHRKKAGYGCTDMFILNKTLRDSILSVRCLDELPADEMQSGLKRRNMILSVSGFHREKKQFNLRSKGFLHSFQKSYFYGQQWSVYNIETTERRIVSENPFLVF